MSSRNYAVLRKQLQLTLDDVNEQDPSDIAYVHTVYAPLSIRLVQRLSHPGWHSIRDVLDLLPGPTLEESQNSGQSSSQGGRRGAGSKSEEGEKPVTNTLVLFVGGCTFAEISALRFLSERENASTNYLVATTSVVNGNSFLQSVMADVHDAMET